MGKHEQAKPVVWVDTTTIGSCGSGWASYSISFTAPAVWPAAGPDAARFPSRYIPGGMPLDLLKPSMSPDELAEWERTRRAKQLLKTWEKLV